MIGLKGTKTQKNLLIAFITECQVSRRYHLTSEVAEKEGYMQIARFFTEIAKQEDGHAKTFLELLEGEGMLEITTSLPVNRIGTTLENLKTFAEVEKHVNSVLYVEFAETAKKEGFNDIAKIFRGVIVAEKLHEKHFKSFAEKIEKNELFSRSEPIEWFCTNCGYHYTGKNALEECPACKLPRGYFSTGEVY